MKLLFLMPFIASAVITEPIIKPNKKIETADFKFMSELFLQGKMTQDMECEIRGRKAQEVRKFKDESQWTDTLELDYRPYRHSDDLKEKIVLTKGLSYGRRESHHISHGSIEEFRIDFEDRKASFLEFSRDGKGNLTGFLFGDINRVYPCRIKRN